VGPQQAEQEAHRRRLARTVRPEEADDLAGRDGEGDVAHRFAAAVPAGEPGGLNHYC
jgi:hypothetical protein